MAQIVKLRSADGVEMEVDADVLQCSGMMQAMLSSLGNEDVDGDNEPIPVTKVNGATLKKVLEWATHHKDDPAPSDDKDDADVKPKRFDDISSWDEKFLKVDQDMLHALTLAANFMDIRGLLELTCKKQASMIVDKKADEIRTMFQLQNDFSEEVAKRIRQENQWAEGK